MGMRTNSKSILAASLIELAKSKPLEKITIKNIVDNCGAGRQTFYNHFKDKYDLINWIYRENAHMIWTTYIVLEPWCKVFNRILVYMTENKVFYFRALNTEGQNSFFEYLFQDLQTSCIKIATKNLEKNPTTTLSSDMLFRIDFYCYGAVNMIKQWTEKGMQESTALFAEYLCNSIPEDLKELLNYRE